MRKTLSVLASAVIALVMVNQANAGIARSNVSAVDMQVYGMYFTDDATCQTGLYATIPLSRTPQTLNMLASPVLGRGLVPATVNCIVIVMKNNVNISWARGTYSTTTSGSSDSVCNGGGTKAVVPCGTSSSSSVSWPAQIRADLAAAGLSAVSTCGGSTADGTEVLPLYLSSYSACTGNSAVDLVSGAQGCNYTTGRPTSWLPPTAANDGLHGFALGGASAQNAYAFVTDPDGIVGNDGSGNCTVTGAPRFGSRGGSSADSVVANPSAPAVLSVTPIAGSSAGSQTITIAGTGFESPASVKVGSSGCNSVSVVSANSITCSTAAGTANTVDVVVTNIGSTLSGTYASIYEYRDAPTVTTIWPTQIASGVNTTVTIQGTGFRNSSTRGAATGTGPTVAIGAVTCTGATIVTAGTGITCAVAHPGTARTALSVLVTNSPDGRAGTRTSTNQGAGFNFL